MPKPSEDCLVVNVWRPKASPPTATKLLPVLVWIHGGGFCAGASSEKWYEGARLASKNGVLVVSLNYRLGPLGFLATPELKRTYGATGGMNGMRDQVTALRWVQRHIASFGGDPSRVTVAGESSGGLSVCTLNTAPSARGLFHRAIIQSGPCIIPSNGWGPHTIAFGYNLSAALMARLNASSIAALRALPAAAVQWDSGTLGLNGFSGYFFDDGFLDEWPRAAYEGGRLNAADGLLLGHTSKDGTAPFYGVAPLANASARAWAAAMHARWGRRAPAVMAHYPLSRFANLSAVPAVPQSFVEADADNVMACPMRTMASLAATRGARAPTYAYVFAHCHVPCDAGFELQQLPWWLPQPRLKGCGWGSHGADNKFVFGTTHGDDSLHAAPYPRLECPFDADEWALADYIGGRWAAFAKGDAPWWPFLAQQGDAAARTGGGAHAPARARPVQGETGGDATTPATRTRTAHLEVKAAWEHPLVDFKASDCAFWAEQEAAE